MKTQLLFLTWFDRDLWDKQLPPNSKEKTLLYSVDILDLIYICGVIVPLGSKAFCILPVFLSYLQDRKMILAEVYAETNFIIRSIF